MQVDRSIHADAEEGRCTNDGADEHAAYEKRVHENKESIAVMVAYRTQRRAAAVIR